MPRFFQPLLLLLARVTDRELAKVVQFQKVENQILRSRIDKRVIVTANERQRLLKFGRALGSGIRDVVSIVSPSTFLRWLREDRQPKTKQSKRKPGRPRTADDVRELVFRLARENAWGYTRILGELKKLGIKVARSTVVNILKEAGLDPCPKRGEQSWSEFIAAHAATLWQCDFFSHTVLTRTGWKACYMLVFLHVGTRRVFLSPASYNPSGDWVAQQATAFVEHLKCVGQNPAATLLFRDRDSKYTGVFDAPLTQAGIEIRPHATTKSEHERVRRTLDSIRACRVPGQVHHIRVATLRASRHRVRRTLSL